MDTHARAALPPLTLHALRVRAVDLPMRRPVQTAAGDLPTSPLVLIDLETEEGVTGSTYVFCYSPVAMVAVAAALRRLAPDLVGADAAPVSLWLRLRRRFRLLGSSGVLGLAFGGVDIAAWDAAARAAGLPLSRLLGAGAGATVPAYGSLKSMAPAAAAEELSERVGEGLSAFKVKVGSGDVSADLAVLHALRSVIGDDAPLMVDYNQTLTVPEALARARRLDEGLTWIEEPVPAEDLDGLAHVAARTLTPIQAGESWWDPRDAARSIAVRGSDLVMLDVARIGGVTGWLRAAALAEAAGLRISSHIYPEVSAHLLAAAPNAHFLEHLDHTSPLLVDPLAITDGSVTVPAGPGIGVGWDEDAVARYAVGG